jgi:hypothetical protein
LAAFMPFPMGKGRSFASTRSVLRPGSRVPFVGFLERDHLREKRRGSRRRLIILSAAIHGIAILALVLLSFWRVEELWSPSVKVTVFPRRTAPPEAVRAVFSVPGAPPAAPLAPGGTP